MRARLCARLPAAVFHFRVSVKPDAASTLKMDLGNQYSIYSELVTCSSVYSAEATDADSDGQNTLRCSSVGALARTVDSSVAAVHLLDWKCSDLKHPCRTNSISRAFRGWSETLSSLIFTACLPSALMCILDQLFIPGQ